MLNNWALALTWLGQPREAERLFRQAIAISTERGSDETVSPVLLNNLVRVLVELDRYAEARVIAERACAAARKNGDAIAVNQCLIMLTTIYVGQGQLERAEATVNELDTNLHQSLPPGHYAFGALYDLRADIAAARGDIAAAIAGRDKVVKLFESAPGARSFLPTALLRRAKIHLQSGDFAGARADASRALELDRQLAGSGQPSSRQGRAWLELGQALAGLGEHDAAHAAFASALQNLRPTLGDEHPETRAAAAGFAGGP